MTGKKPMHIVTVASEATPFVKTGGLADVVGSLFSNLSDDRRMTLILPYYKTADIQFPDTEIEERCSILIGAQNHEAVFHRCRISDNQELLLVEQDLFFQRPGIYGLDGQDYPDNFHRFFFFCNAAAQWIIRHHHQVNVVHCHDWQSGLVPMLLKTSTHPTPPCLFTIHNISFQGRFPEHCYALTHLPRHHFNPDGVEFYGELNFMKGGIRYSERINTVSPTYAQEIQTPEYGAGLDGLLRNRSADLSGILNGIDIDIWNPADDPLISHPFQGDCSVWKAACRSELRRELGLEESPLPLFIMIGRLTHQKGIDLVLDAWECHPPRAQLVVLGTGEPQAQRRLQKLQEDMPSVRVLNRFSEPMAHRMQAGADFFLMPSRFEPCGLTQMVAQRYGTIPLVTQTGGLRDTVVPVGPGEEATGIAILTADTAGIGRSLHQAISLYDQPEQLLSLRRRGMSRDFSWKGSSRQYKALYDQIDAIYHGKRSPLLHS